MAKAENKTRATDADVLAFVAKIENNTRRADAEKLLDIYGAATGLKPVMWGPMIIGYGQYHYAYDSGHEGEMCRAGFSPRKANLVLYLTDVTSSPEAEKTMDQLSAKLGKHNRRGSCLYINRLADVDAEILKEMIALSLAQMDEKYPR